MVSHHKTIQGTFGGRKLNKAVIIDCGWFLLPDLIQSTKSIFRRHAKGWVGKGSCSLLFILRIFIYTVQVNNMLTRLFVFLCKHSVVISVSLTLQRTCQTTLFSSLSATGSTPSKWASIRTTSSQPDTQHWIPFRPWVQSEWSQIIQSAITVSKSTLKGNKMASKEQKNGVIVIKLIRLLSLIKKVSAQYVCTVSCRLLLNVFPIYFLIWWCFNII